MTASKNDEKPDREVDSGKGQFSVLSVLVWAVAPAAVFGGLLGISSLSDESGLTMLFFLLFILPAALIFEALGLGTYSIFDGTLPPAMWPIMIMLAYVYGLVLVLVVRGLWRLISSTGRRIRRPA